MTLFRKTLNESPHCDSAHGLHPATSAYQLIHCERVGRPGVEADAAKAGFILEARPLGPERVAKVKGESRLEMSERGWPIVDISQLQR